MSRSRREFLAASAGVAAGVSAIGGLREALAQPTPATVKADQPVRLGLIGAGGRCHDLLTWTFSNKANNVVVKAMAEPNPANAAKLIKLVADNGGSAPEVYAGEHDWRDKLLARTDLDAVIVAVPPDLHAEMYLGCFKAGKHFYGEKPMCVSVGEIDALVAAQKAHPEVLCQIGFQRRASTWYKAAVAKIHEGLIGDVFEALGAWRLSGGPLGLPDSGTQIWFGRAKRSGDWMLEQACHTWDVMCWVAKEIPVAAYGRGRRGLFKHIDPDRDVTDFYTAIVEFPGGMQLDFEHNWMCPQFDEKRDFTGVFERFTGPKGGVSLGEWPASCTYYPRDGKDKVIQLGDSSVNTTGESIATFYQCVRSGQRPPSTVEHGRAATLTGLLVRKAVYEGRRVEMKEILAS